MRNNRALPLGHMTDEEKREKCLAGMRASSVAGMDAARRWRDEKLVEQSELALRRAADPECPRCEGTGRVLWFGHRGQGGVDGPCIRCHPLAAAQFAENHNPFNLRRQNDGIR